MHCLPQRLKIIRGEKGYTQRKVAAKMHISASTIALYETGDRNPDPQMLKRLADFFDCSVDWLLGRVPLEGTNQFGGTPPLAQKQEILAAHRTDDPTLELPIEARRSLDEFREYILQKYGIK